MRPEAIVLGMRVKLQPVEEMIWSKAFVMERERSDAADVAHLILKCSGSIDWDRLVARFGANWRVLFAHLVLFGFVYPSERTRVPARLLRDLWGRLQQELGDDGAGAGVQRDHSLARAVPDGRGAVGLRGRARRSARQHVAGGRCALDGGHRPWALTIRPSGSIVRGTRPCSRHRRVGLLLAALASAGLLGIGGA